MRSKGVNFKQKDHDNDQGKRGWQPCESWTFPANHERQGTNRRRAEPEKRHWYLLVGDLGMSRAGQSEHGSSNKNKRDEKRERIVLNTTCARA